jgi:hypothetical protein
MWNNSRARGVHGYASSRRAAAEAMGLPFVRPYWGGQTAGNFASGANFAVGGATALSPDFFRERGVPMDDDTVHLDMEMEWFRDLLGMLCTGGDMDGCKGMMNQSLFLVGEIGGNDYNLPLMSGMSIEKIRNFTPSVIAKISSIITVSNMPMLHHFIYLQFLFHKTIQYYKACNETKLSS